MLSIYCICGMGLGTSLIAKMNVESILSEANISAKVENCDLGSVTGVQADYYVTTEELAQNMPEELKNKTIVLSDFINVEEIKNVLLPVIEGEQ